MYVHMYVCMYVCMYVHTYVIVILDHNHKCDVYQLLHETNSDSGQKSEVECNNNDTPLIL